VRDEAVCHLDPIRAELHSGDREHEQAQPSVAEDALHPFEAHRPEHDRQCEDAEREEHTVRKAGEQLQRDRDAADLCGERQEVDDLRGDQRRQPGREACAFADRVEDRLPGDGGDATAHLGVDDDPDDADRDHPHQLVSQRSRRPRC